MVMDIFQLFLISVIPLVISEKIVKTKTGKVLSKTVNVYNKKVEAYLGIPYATPPIGNLRFKKPQPKIPWLNVYVAKFPASICMQNVTKSDFDFVPKSKLMSEDCLYLNLWVPSEERKDYWPTMVWIHGGGFQVGSSTLDIYDGRMLAAMGEVIVASMNYRLGVFGFLNMRTTDAPGNVGLLDQIEALRWLHNNIEFFGGNPGSITLFGECAGAISISLHLLTPLTKNLFNRAILQSGSAYHPSIIDDNIESSDKAHQFAAKVGCSEPGKIVSCLRNLPASKLLEYSQSMIFMPSYGDEFLYNHPRSVVNSKKVHGVDIIIGIVRDAGSIFLGNMQPNLFKVSNPEFNLSHGQHLVERYFSELSKTKDIPRTKHIIREYFRYKCISYDVILKNTYDAIGDFLLRCPSIILADKVAKKKNSKVYFYTFNHRRYKSTLPEWLGVPRFEEVYFVFGMPFLMRDEFTVEEEHLSRTIIELWSSFARNGDPVSSSFSYSWRWPEYSEDVPHHLDLNIKSEIKFRYEDDKCGFWKIYYDIECRI